MSKQKILEEIDSLIEGRFETTDVDYIPRISDPALDFGINGLTIDATVLFIDLRGSTKILNNFNTSTVAKIHKAYYHSIVKIAKMHKGHPRSFNGDSLLVFFNGSSKEVIVNALFAAGKMNYFLSSDDGINSIISKYTKIDFGIGLDFGSITCTKVGMGTDSANRDLIWLGNAVNKACALSELGKTGQNVFVSKEFYDKLPESFKTEEILGGLLNIDTWDSEWYDYGDEELKGYYMNYQIVLE